MARISLAKPSNNDISKETTLLTKQGKIDATSKPFEWDTNHWKAGQ